MGITESAKKLYNFSVFQRPYIYFKVVLDVKLQRYFNLFWFYAM